MIQLLIDGKPAALPSGFSFSLTVENPYFTNSGEYSSEVQLSALAPENIKIFGQFSRFEKTRRKQVRGFELVSGGETIMAGKAVTIAFTSNYVTVQLLGSNSSINFMSRYDNMYIDNMRKEMGKMLSDWHWVTNCVWSNGDYARYVMKDPSESDWIMLPTLTDTGQQVNCRGIDFGMIGIENAGKIGFGYPMTPDENSPETFALQPRMCPLIRKVVEAMGFTVRTFDAEQTHLKYLYYVNVQHSLYWTDIMPHWTCSKFIDEVQNLFGCVFVFDTVNMVCDIKARTRFFAEDAVHLSKVDDSFEAENDDDEADINNSVLQYNTDELSARHVFDGASIERIKYIEESRRDTAELMLKSGMSNLVVSVDGHWLIRHIVRDEDGNPTGEATIEEVNDIGCRLADDVDIAKSTELDIVPAKMSYVKVPLYTTDYVGVSSSRSEWKIPAPVGSYPSKSGVFDVDAYVQSGESSVSENSLQLMRVAFFTSWDVMPNCMMFVHHPRLSNPNYGSIDIARFNANMRLFCGWSYPYDDISKPAEDEKGFSQSGVEQGACGWDVYTNYMRWDPNCALRNKSGERTIYSGGIQQAQVINTTLPHTFRVYDDVAFTDVFKTFIIRGHKYVCKQLEYKVSVNGIEKVKQGTFYQID